MASSVAFATPLIGEAHADMSSAAVEIFSVGNATLDIMGLSYVVEEMGMTFPIPFTLEMDNDAARIFCLGSAHKTKLLKAHRLPPRVGEMPPGQEDNDSCTCRLQRQRCRSFHEDTVKGTIRDGPQPYHG